MTFPDGTVAEVVWSGRDALLPAEYPSIRHSQMDQRARKVTRPYLIVRRTVRLCWCGRITDRTHARCTRHRS